MSDGVMSREVQDIHFDIVSSSYTPAWIQGKIGVPKEWGPELIAECREALKREIMRVCGDIEREFSRKKEDGNG